MSLWRQFARGLRALTRRSTVDRELDDEVRDYFERARADLDLERLSPREAARVERLRLGDPDKAREELRSYGWENVVSSPRWATCGWPCAGWRTARALPPSAS